MTNSDELRANRPQDDLPAPYRAAVEAVLAEPVPEIDLQRLVSLQPTPGPTVSEPAGRRWKITAWSLGTAAALAVLAVGWLSHKGSDAWADVVQAVQTVPWIHLKAGGQEPVEMECWFSPPQRIIAWRMKNAKNEVVGALFEGLGCGIREEFDINSGSVFRLPSRGKSANELESISKLFLRGEAVVGERVAMMGRVMEQKTRSGYDSDGAWKELELKFDAPNEPMLMVVHIDPKSNLPAWIRVGLAGKPMKQVGLDYPKQGPTDIYALGVPKNTPLVDQIPSKDLQAVLDQLKASFYGFGDYTEIECQSRGVPERILRFKGKKWRMDECVPTERVEKLPRSEQELIAVTSQSAWWKNRLKQYDTRPVLIGNGVHLFRFGTDQEGKPTPSKWNVVRNDIQGRFAAMSEGDTEHFLMEMLAYPAVEPYQGAEISLLSADATDPPGTIILETKVTGPHRMCDLVRYWLDPKYGYVAVKKEIRGGKDFGSLNYAYPFDPYRDIDQTNTVHVFEDFKRSPKGLWYPTVMRWKNAVSEENTDGKKEQRDLMTYFYLDFEMEMPDDSFDPQMQ